MSKLAFLTSGTGVTLGAGGAIVVAVVAAGYMSGVFTTAPQQLVVPAVQPRVPANETVVTTPSPEPEKPVVQADENGSKSPAFDVVRVERDGTTMIAGSAEAGSTVAVRLGDRTVAQVQADAGGKFASFVSLPESAEPQILTLSTPDGEAGEEQVIVAAISKTAQAPVQSPVQSPVSVITTTKPVAETKQEIEPAQEDVAVASKSQSEAPVGVPVADAQPVADKPETPTVLLASKEGVRVLQAPDAPKPEAMTALLGAISYDAQGDVALTGRGGGEFVRVYLDNLPVSTSQIQSNGDWQVSLPNVDTGVYTLRVDELNATGDVVTRIETPFKREAAETLAAATQPDKPIQAITVQPGATLWAIAQERYGSGVFYTRVVEANAALIRDPDLIFPGQVFTVPN